MEDGKAILPGTEEPGDVNIESVLDDGTTRGERFHSMEELNSYLSNIVMYRPHKVRLSSTTEHRRRALRIEDSTTGNTDNS